MAFNRAGWAVEVNGEKIDIEDLRDMLTPGFDPWTEEYEGTVLLRTKQFEQFATARELRIYAQVLQQMLYGAALLQHSDARPLSLGRILKFGADGKPQDFINTGTLNITEQGDRARGRGMVGNGKPSKPKASTAQKRLTAASNSAATADLLVFLARSDNWYDLYKAMETARGLKGDEPRLKEQLADDWLEWERVWREANHHRHAPNVGPTTRPTSPPSLDEARQFVLTSIARLF